MSLLVAPAGLQGGGGQSAEPTDREVERSNQAENAADVLRVQLKEQRVTVMELVTINRAMEVDNSFTICCFCSVS